MPPFRVALLDDEHSTVTLLSRVLKEYDVNAYTCPDSFLRQADGGVDCFLLDVQIPGSSGYDVCRELRAKQGTAHTPVIFVSGQTDLDNRLQGYAAGADDFICKPFDIQELRAKVDRAMRQKQLHNELISSADEARQAAFEAMTHSAEQGEITRFIEQVTVCKTPQELVVMLIATLKNFGLNAVVAVWDDEEYSSHAGDVRPLEQELLHTCRTGQRIIAMGKRLVVNYPKASLLIKNAPWEDDSRYGRFKDHLCVLMSGVNARLTSMATEQRYRRQKTLLAAMGDVQTALQRIRVQQHARMQIAQEAVQELELELAEELLLLNLDADQEAHMTSLVKAHIMQLETLYRDGADINALLEPVMSVLREMASSSDLA